jgi:hypothetical protein
VFLEEAISAIARATNTKRLTMDLLRPASTLWRESKVIFIPGNRTLQFSEDKTNPWKQVKLLTQRVVENRKELYQEDALRAITRNVISSASEAEICDIWRRFLLPEVPVQELRYSAKLGGLIIVVSGDGRILVDVCQDELSGARK